jgi:hypothetical protein
MLSKTKIAQTADRRPLAVCAILVYNLSHPMTFSDANNFRF